MHAFTQLPNSMKSPSLSLLLLLFSLTKSSPTSDRRRLIDDTIHSAALRSFPAHHKTGVPYTVPLPPSLSSASARAMRFRAGRLRRQGASLSAFRLSPGLIPRPHSKRLLLVLQNLGPLSPSLYSISGHRLISPILGLLIYDAFGPNSTQLDVRVTKDPILVNFSTVIKAAEEEEEEFLCAVFGLDGGVEVSGEGRVCFARGAGHFGVVVREKGVRRWKEVVGALGAAGAVLVGFVVVAVVKGRRKEGRMAEMERRASEDEALRVAIVGSVKACAAAPVRTAPVMEEEEGFHK